MSTKNNPMRVFLDTNVIISALISKNSSSDILLRYLVNNHTVLISSHSIDELTSVIARKFPTLTMKLDEFLSTLEYETVHTPKNLAMENIPSIRDNADKPILISVLLSNPDIFITGDDDFNTKEIRDQVAIYSPQQFLVTFCPEDH